MKATFLRLIFVHYYFRLQDMSNKILIVDDDLYLRELYQEVFTSEGFEVDTAADGKVGYEKLSTNQYHAVLLDIMLPQLDGIGILTKLKESNASYPFQSIILLSNLSHDETFKQAQSIGVKICITKSAITPDQLVAKVKEILNSSPAPATKPAPAAKTYPATKPEPTTIVMAPETLS